MGGTGETAERRGGSKKQAGQNLHSLPKRKSANEISPSPRPAFARISPRSMLARIALRPAPSLSFRAFSSSPRYNMEIKTVTVFGAGKSSHRIAAPLRSYCANHS